MELEKINVKQGFFKRYFQSDVALKRGAAYMFLVLIFLAVVFVIDSSGQKHYDDSSTDMSNAWEDEAGKIVDLEALPLGVLSLTTHLEKDEIKNRRLCMRSIDTFFDIYADGELIYSYHPTQPKLLGISYGMYIHEISIPQETRELRMKAIPIFPETPAKFVGAVIEDPGMFTADLFKNNLSLFLRSIMIMLSGVLFLGLGFFNGVLSRSTGLDFIAFGAMAAMMGFSGLNETMLLQVLTQEPASIRVATYVCLIFIPYPALAFFAGATGNRHSGLLPTILAMCLANFVFTVALTYSGVTDYYYMVNLTHLIIVIDLGFIIFMVARAVVRHNIRPQLMKSLIIGLLACFVGIAIDMIRYHVDRGTGFSTFTGLGVLIFMVTMGVYLFVEQIRGLKQKQHDDKLFIEEITETFAKVIDMKDRYTTGHSFRVARYTAMLSRELALDEETVEKYYRIALLHDIGKIGIPTELLNKPGKLSDEEFEIIKSHAAKGYEVLKDISIMPELAVGAKSHHERPDGMGYPNGLKDGEIPFVAQIIAVADTFDAMYSDRPYRKRMNYDRAVSIIKEVSGTQLSSVVVDAFLRLAEQGLLKAKDDDGGGTFEDITNIRKKLK